MKDKPENPAAFPTKGGMSYYFPEERKEELQPVIDRFSKSMEGMTLLDYFAAKAMQALLTDYNTHSHTYKDIPGVAYQMATRMLEEREKRLS